MTVTRFAPSPTGFLHVGGARTAIYSWAWARRNGGRFLLRIEDTDRTRYRAEAMQDILESLRWLGLDWDEGPEVGGPHGPYVQSERTAIYREHAERLLAEGKAYRCFCTSERLEELRRSQGADQAGYDRRCAAIPSAEAARRASSGEPYVLRFRMPAEGSTTFEDAIRGFIEYPNAQQDDFVIMKTDGFPTYHLANVVDDRAMEVTHVMRGEEWIPSTPKHVRLYEAFGWPAPVFAHLPVILSPDGDKLSKRHGAVSVREYREQGYLPEALVNYLALLGWSPGDDREILSVGEIASLFDLARVNKRGAVFDTAKLQWMNGKYLETADAGRIAGLLAPHVAGFGIDAARLEAWGCVPDPDAWLEGVTHLAKSRVRLVPECVEKVRFFFEDAIVMDPEAVAKHLTPSEGHSVEELRARLMIAREAIVAASWTIEGIEAELRSRLKAAGIKPPLVFQPLRVALTGRMESPGIFETVYFIGRARAIARIDDAQGKLRVEG